MKKIISFSALFLGCIMLAGTAAHAAIIVTAEQASAGDTITLTPVDGSGPDLDFNPSPSNLMVATTSENAYIIESMNAAASDGQRMEYGIMYSGTGYYQHLNGATTDADGLDRSDIEVDITGLADLTTNVFANAGWTPIGGGGGS